MAEKIMTNRDIPAGMLVIYKADESVAWAANCHGKNGFYLTLMVYDSIISL